MILLLRGDEFKNCELGGNGGEEFLCKRMYRGVVFLLQVF